MKNLATASKGVGALAVVIFTYINTNLSPVFYLLLVLAALDYLLNFHNEGKQLQKIGAAIGATGFPLYLSTNASSLLHLDPTVLKVAVVILTIGYIQIVFPQLIALVGKIKFSTNKAVNAADAAILQERLKVAEAELLKITEAQKTSLTQATTPGTQTANKPGQP